MGVCFGFPWILNIAGQTWKIQGNFSVIYEQYMENFPRINTVRLYKKDLMVYYE